MGDREVDGKTGGEFLDELFSALEDLETQSAGVVQFLKDKGLASEAELAPYLEAAAEASEVRWRAARLRMDALLTAAIKDAEEEFARTIEERKDAAAKREAGEVASNPKGETEDVSEQAESRTPEAESAKNEGTEAARKTAKPAKDAETEGRETSDAMQASSPINAEKDQNSQTNSKEENPGTKAA